MENIRLPSEWKNGKLEERKELTGLDFNQTGAGYEFCCKSEWGKSDVRIAGSRRLDLHLDGGLHSICSGTRTIYVTAVTTVQSSAFLSMPGQCNCVFPNELQAYCRGIYSLLKAIIPSHHIEWSVFLPIPQLDQAAPEDCELPNGDSRGRTTGAV